MNQIMDFLKKSGRSNIIASIIFGIFGVILCVFSESAAIAISWMIGLFFIAIGIARLITYVQGRAIGEYYNFSLLVGLIATLIGILIIIYADAVSAIIRIVIGIWIIYNGLVRMRLSLKLKEINSQVWIYTIILAIAIILLGLFIALNSGAIISLIGGMMIAYAILDIIESMIFIKKLRQF